MKKITLLLFPLLCIVASSCITIEENYTFKKNGAGSLEYRIDMSEMSSLLNMAGENSENPMGEEMSLDDLQEKVEGIKGITNVEAIENKKDFIFGVRFDFADLNALNAGLNALLLENAELEEPFTFFEMDGKTLVRHHRLTKNMNTDDILGDDENAEYAMTLMESMKYNINYKFKKPIRVVYSPGNASFEDKKQKSLALSASFKELIDNPEMLSSTITTK
ncbi:MAG: hypothetical protein AAGI38_20020 [Bacteroidota bacterium]